MSQHAEYEPIDLAREAEFALGAIRVQPASREVIIEGQPEVFEPRVLQVLVALAQRRGNVVSRDELSARCWEGRAVGEDALNRCIARIRRLAQASGEFTVETIPRVGYRLATVGGTGPTEATMAPEPATSAPLQSPSPTHEGRDGFAKRHARALLGVVVVLVGIATVSAYFAWRNSRVIEVGLDEHVVIVLPFKGLNDDPDSQHFAQSISASIAYVLSQSGQRVISPAKAEKFRGADRARAAEETGARFIIDGEVRREGNLIRAVVRVDDGRIGRTLMSSEFESDPAGAAGLADRVAGYIGMRAWIFSLRAIRSENAEVNNARFRSHDLGFRAAYDLASEMARKYPNDAQALMVFSINSAFSYWALPPEEVAPALRAGRAAAERVTELAPTFGDTYFALSMLVPPQRWTQREAYLRKGLEIEPDAPGLGIVLARFLAEVGRWRAAEVLASSVTGRDPFNPTKVMDSFTIHRLVGNQDAADALNKMGERYWPGQMGFEAQRFWTSDFRGNAAEPVGLMLDPATAAMIEPETRKPRIRQILRALASRHPDDIDAAVKGCFGEWVSNETTLVCLLGMSELGRLDDTYRLASLAYPDIRAATPELEEAQWLRREKPFFDTTVLYRAEWAPMRADTRFIALVERIRLLDYWRAGHPPDFCETERVPVCEALRKNAEK